MAKIEIRRATPADMEDVGRLCWAYRDLLVARSTHLPTFIGTYYAAETYDAMIADLPRIHARPKGGILVASLSGAVVGCAMYYPIDTTTTEIKRVFVSPEARGTGAGRALIAQAMVLAKADGFARMVLDSIAPLTEAIALYERMGFSPCDPFYDPDPDLRHALRFYDIAL